MKRILLSFAISTLSLIAADHSEYPIGIAVYPRGTKVVLSTGRTINDYLITIEPYMIKKAKFWKPEKKIKTSFSPEIACEVMQFIYGSDVQVGFEIHFYSPEEIIENKRMDAQNRFLRRTV